MATLAGLVADRIFYTGHLVNASVSTIGRGANLYAFNGTHVVGDLDTVHFVPDYFAKSSAALLESLIAGESLRSLHLLIQACVPDARQNPHWSTLAAVIGEPGRGSVPGFDPRDDRTLLRLASDLRAWLESVAPAFRREDVRPSPREGVGPSPDRL